MEEDNVGSLVSVTLVVAGEVQSFDDNTCLLLERISELLSPFSEVVKVEQKDVVDDGIGGRDAVRLDAVIVSLDNEDKLVSFIVKWGRGVTFTLFIIN